MALLERNFLLAETRDEFRIWSQWLRPTLNVPANVLNIRAYRFTEVLNNAIDHSRETSVIVRCHDERNGTRVYMAIGRDAKTSSEAIFNHYCDPERLPLCKTRFAVSLAAFEGNLVSRSQAKRVAARFEEFSEVELDFSRVETIGQAFADELLRGWPLSHSQTTLRVVNALEPVEKIIAHVRGRTDLPQPGAC